MKFNKNHRLISIILFLSTIYFACIDNIDVEIDRAEPKLVVEGLISDLVGQSFIKLSSTGNFKGFINPDFNALISGAQIFVTVNDSQQITFCEKSIGFYQPDDSSYIGSIGSTYKLFLQTANGRIYQSIDELLAPGLSVKEIIVDYRKETMIGSDQETGFHDIFAILENPNHEDFFFRIKSRGIVEVATDILPRPDTCNTTRCVEICWASRNPIERSVIVGNSQLLSGTETSIRVASPEYDFHLDYLVKVEALSLSKSGFEYWNLLNNQLAIQGNIYDPVIPDIKGNISNINDESEIVVGYFGASSVSQKSLLFERFGNGPNFTFPIPIAASCEVAWGSVTDVRPDEFD